MIPTFVVEVTRATETPHSNTGLNRQDPHGTGISVGLDYLVLTGSGDIDELMKIIWAGTGTSFDTDKIRGGFRGVWYDRILASSSTIELAVRHNHDEPQFPKYRLSIPGKPLRAMLADTLMSFCDSLKAFGAVATRFDWAIDDYDRQISLSVFEEAGRNNNVFGCTEMGVTERRKFAQTQRTPTIYFGSTQSDKFVRIYDKFLESKGKIDAIRYEVQWRNKYASRLFDVFSSGGDLQSRVQSMSNFAVGAIRFGERISSVASRNESFEWWTKFVDRVGTSAKLSVRIVQREIEDKIKWVEKQVAGTLALIALCQGLDETLEWLERHIRVKVRQISLGSNHFFKTFRDRIITEEMGYEKSLDLFKPSNSNHQLCLRF